MKKTYRFARIVSLALFFAIFVSFWGSGLPARAQAGGAPSGPTTHDCFSARYHAAADCDRIASGAAVVQGAALIRVDVPVTGARPFGPTPADCYSAKFHAASDCDRLALGR